MLCAPDALFIVAFQLFDKTGTGNISFGMYTANSLKNVFCFTDVLAMSTKIKDSWITNCEVSLKMGLNIKICCFFYSWLHFVKCLKEPCSEQS